jgi:diguanylate cyclase (GGDEF)-like protein
MIRNENLGLTDRMTGLKNYDCFVSELDEMTAEALEKNEDLTLAMIDIDHFANVNNQYGHAVGG